MAKKQVIERQISDNRDENKASYLMNGSRSILQQIAPASILYTSEHELMVENNFVKSFVINGYPSRVSLGWMDGLYSYNGDMDVVTYIEPANERTALDELTSKITQYEAQYQTEIEKGSIKNLSILESKISALYQQRARLEQNFENMFHIATFCSMYNHDLRELNKSAQKFQSSISGGKMNLMPLTLRQDDGFKTVSPFGDIKITDYYRNMNSSALSTMFPFYNSEVNHPNGTFVGINRKRRTPIFIDFFNKKELGNTNLFISGASGSGKTYLTSLITMRSCLEGIRTVIIDPENEYGRCADAVGGVTVKIAPNSDVMMNPFDIDMEYVLDDNGNVIDKRIDIKGKSAELLNLFSVMFPDLITSELKADISEVLIDMYESFGFTSNPDSLYNYVKNFDKETGLISQYKELKIMPRMSDFKAYLEAYYETNPSQQLASFINSMRVYTEGGIYGMFDCYSTVNADLFENSPIIRFDIQGIEDEVLRPIGMHIVLNWCWDKFIKRDLKTKKRLVCDEAWLMLQKNMKGSNYTALFLEKCARRIRKYNGSLCCASQNFREFVSRDEGLAILSNSAVRIFLKQTPEDIQAVGDRFILSDGEKGFLLSAGRGEALMKVVKESFVADVFAFPFEDELISKEYLED